MVNSQVGLLQGTLDRWNDQKGFGFIRPTDVSRDVFIHISAFKYLPRRPRDGDTILYQLETGEDGRLKAASASIKGLQTRRAKIGSSSRSASPYRARVGRRGLARLLPVAVIAVAGVLVARGTLIGWLPSLKSGDGAQAPQEGAAPLALSAAAPAFQCRGKVYCSEMVSCEEAKFYLRNCPGTKMDGDRDGVPCENQWCRW